MRCLIYMFRVWCLTLELRKTWECSWGWKPCMVRFISLVTASLWSCNLQMRIENRTFSNSSRGKTFMKYSAIHNMCSIYCSRCDLSVCRSDAWHLRRVLFFEPECLCNSPLTLLVHPFHSLLMAILKSRMTYIVASWSSGGYMATQIIMMLP